MHQAFAVGNALLERNHRFGTGYPLDVVHHEDDLFGVMRIARLDLAEDIVLPGRLVRHHHVGDLAQLVDHMLGQFGLGQVDTHVGCKGKSHLGVVDVQGRTRDDPRLFHLAYAYMYRTGGNDEFLGDLGIGHPGIFYQQFQDLVVYLVQLVSGNGFEVGFIFHSRRCFCF